METGPFVAQMQGEPVQYTMRASSNTQDHTPVIVIPAYSTMKQARDIIVSTTLARLGGDKAKTAKALGVCLKTLYNWINKPRA